LGQGRGSNAVGGISIRNRGQLSILEMLLVIKIFSVLVYDNVTHRGGLLYCSRRAINHRMMITMMNTFNNNYRNSSDRGGERDHRKYCK